MLTTRLTLMRALSIACLVTLSSCGGGGSEKTTSADTVLEGALGAIQPAYHRLADPVDAPSRIDADGSESSAKQPPAQIILAPDRIGLTRSGIGSDAISYGNNALSGAEALIKPATPVVYTPAQIRAAYNLPPLATATPAELGAGQTIYIINAYHHPNTLADLNQFSANFGLPQCSEEVIPLDAVKLSAPDKTQCKFSTIFTNASGAAVSTAPQYVTMWAYEIALDTQWAHAIAPLARLVLIEADDASPNTLVNAISMANKLGIGAVSMSFVANESDWVQDSKYSSVFDAPRMTYFAASGDSGTQVNWPSVVPTVVAVGGTTLAYDGTTRTETLWGGSGGGVSKYFAKPFYQNNLKVSGESVSGPSGRAVADVSMIGDPSAGAYTQFTEPGKNSTWYSLGGTSLGTPIWAAISALINAKKITQSPQKSAFHKTLYSFANSAATYQSMMYDINSGANGTCTYCQAETFYDTPSGMGSPNAANLIEYFRRMP